MAASLYRAPEPPRTVSIVGLGLLGGSLARALRARSLATYVLGIDPSGEALQRALHDGSIDRGHATIDDAASALYASDLVFLCAPVAAIEATIGPVSRRMRAGAILTDAAGVKVSVCDRARVDCAKHVRFVGAHPMFGGPDGGFARARGDLWTTGAVAICTDDADPSAVDEIARVHEALGARVVFCTADAHDRACALVSHAPFVVATALRQLLDDGSLAAEIAGPGFEGATRLARFAFDIQGEVALRNAHLGPTLDALIARLTTLRAALADGATTAERAFAADRRDEG